MSATGIRATRNAARRQALQEQADWADNLLTTLFEAADACPYCHAADDGERSTNEHAEDCELAAYFHAYPRTGRGAA